MLLIYVSKNFKLKYVGEKHPDREMKSIFLGPDQALQIQFEKR